MDLIEKLLRQKYLLPDEEIFEPAASEVRHLLGTQIMSEIANMIDEIKTVDNKMLEQVRKKLNELNVKSYWGTLNEHKARFYKMVNKI